MRFEVVNRDGNTVFHTESVTCMPPESDLKAMEAGGYKFRLDGKFVKLNKLKDSMNQTVEKNESTPKSRRVSSGKKHLF